MVKKLSDTFISKTFLYITLAVIAIAITIAMWATPLFGDGYFYRNLASITIDSFYGLILFLGRFFLTCNGRLIDIFSGPILLFIPSFVLFPLCGLLVAAYYLLIVKCSRFSQSDMLGQSVALIVTTLVMPWWDYSLIAVIHFNYIWPIVMTMAVLYILFYSQTRNRLVLWLTLFIAIPAGGGHEACGGPISAALVIWMFFNRHKHPLQGLRLAILIFYVIGSLSPYISPAGWNRLNENSVQDDPYLILLLKNCFVVILLIITLAVAWITGHTTRLLQLFKSPWLIWVVGAIISMFTSTMGGIVGRAGWFAQTWALIALFQWIWPYVKISKSMSHWLSTSLILLLCLYMVDFARWQVRLGGEANDILSDYRANPSQPVARDYTRLDEIPLYLLYKTIPVSNPELYIATYTVITEVEGNSMPLIVIPRELASRDMSNFSGEERFGHDYVTSRLPEKIGRDSVITRDATVYKVIGFTKDSRRLWLLTPRELVWGQRL